MFQGTAEDIQGRCRSLGMVSTSLLSRRVPGSKLTQCSPRGWKMWADRRAGRGRWGREDPKIRPPFYISHRHFTASFLGFGLAVSKWSRVSKLHFLCTIELVRVQTFQGYKAGLTQFMETDWLEHCLEHNNPNSYVSTVITIIVMCN